MFYTTDLDLAAALSCLGFTLRNLEAINPKRVEMGFDSTAALLETVEDFWSGKLLVEPRSLFHHRKQVKARAHDTSLNN